MLLFLFDGLQLLEHVRVHDLALHFSVVAEYLLNWSDLKLNHIGGHAELSFLNGFSGFLLFRGIHGTERERGRVVRIEHLVDDLVCNTRLAFSKCIIETTGELSLLGGSRLILLALGLTKPTKTIADENRAISTYLLRRSTLLSLSDI